MNSAAYIAQYENKEIEEKLENMDIWTKHISTNFTSFVHKNTAARDSDFIILHITEDEDIYSDSSALVDTIDFLQSFSRTKLILLLQQCEQNDDLQVKIADTEIGAIIEYDKWDYETNAIMGKLEQAVTDVAVNLDIQPTLYKESYKLQPRLRDTVRIGYIGTKACVGCTTQAMLTADYCIRKGYKPCLIVSEDLFYSIKEHYPCTDMDEYLEVGYRAVAIDEPQDKGFNVFIYDVGKISKRNASIIDKLDIPIIISTSKKWDIEHLENTLEKIGTQNKVSVWFSFSSHREIYRLDELSNQIADVQILPYSTDPFGTAKRQFYNSQLLPKIVEVQRG